MNWVDFVILLVVLIFAQEGLRRGLFVQLFDIIGFAVALVAALNFYPQGASLLVKLFSMPKIAASPIGFLLIWIVAESIFFTIASPFFRKIAISRHESPTNKLLGFIPATVNALLLCAFALLFVVSLPIRPDIKKDVFDSKIGSVLVEKATILERPLNSVFGPIAKQGLTFLTVSPEAKGSVDLAFTQAEITSDFESERIMLAKINEERTSRGFKPLMWDESLAEIGREHSSDMFAKGYFSHYSPEGEDVGDRLDKARIPYSFAGENLALAPSVIRAHDGLMNSPGHRRNILDPAFVKIGIGAVDGGIYGKMFTQVFTN